MAIYKRGNVYWCHFSVDGKRYQSTTGCTKKTDALKVERERKREARQAGTIAVLEKPIESPVTDKDGLPLADCLDKYTIACGGSIGVKGTFWSDFMAYLSDLYPDCSTLDCVSVDMATRYVDHLRKHGKWDKTIRYTRKGKEYSYQSKNKKLASKTIKDYIVLIGHVFSTLGADNPFSGIQRPKVRQVSRQPYTADELQAIHDYTKKADPLVYHIYMVGIHTALRLGDIANLKWSQIQGEWLIVDTRKRGKTVRLPISSGFHSYLSTCHSNSDHVCPELATMYKDNPSCISGRVKRVLSSCEIENKTSVEGRTRKVSVKDVHAIRHTALTLMARNGVPIHVLQAVAGHSTASMTLKYAHASDDDCKRIVSALPSFSDNQEEDDIKSLVESMNGDNWKDVKAKLLTLV
jgi:integrase